jgi:hypothetical protein
MRRGIIFVQKTKLAPGTGSQPLSEDSYSFSPGPGQAQLPGYARPALPMPTFIHERVLR